MLKPSLEVWYRHHDPLWSSFSQFPSLHPQDRQKLTHSIGLFTGEIRLGKLWARLHSMSLSLSLKPGQLHMCTPLMDAKLVSAGIYRE